MATPSLTRGISQSPAQQESELTVASWCLHHKRSSVFAFDVQPEHFVTNPSFRVPWKRAQQCERQGIDWFPSRVFAGHESAATLAASWSSGYGLDTVSASARLIRVGATIHRAGLELGAWSSGLGRRTSVYEARDALDAILARIDFGEDVVSEPMQTLVPRALRELVERDGSPLVEIPILARECHGWRPGKFYLIGGVTSTHKTTYALNAAVTAATHDHPALYWTLEDDTLEMAQRIISSFAERIGVSTFDSWPGGRFPDDTAADLVRASTKAQRLPLRMLDKPATLPRIIAGITEEVHRHRLGIVFVDFMQLITREDAKQDDVQHVTDAAQALAALAKKLSIPIIAVVQLTQAATNRIEQSGEAPRLGDVRGGSSIAQAAYGVVMTHRPAPKGEDCDPQAFQLWVRKWKRARLGMIACRVDGAHDRIMPLGQEVTP